MHKTIKARYHDGRLEPLELDEGSEVLITIDSPAAGSPSGADPTLATSGVFKGSDHWAQLEKDLEERRCSLPPLR
jgi:predicted DNA-binding antitoxin AbrB/MazE fold protein